MELAPPSYKAATIIDPICLIAPYLKLRELCSAALVCRRWYTSLISYLWGNPAAHFDSSVDAAGFKLNAYLHCLIFSRESICQATHTLCVPVPGAYDEPFHPSWLRTALLRLPNLQSLIARVQEHFDHKALLAFDLTPSPTVHQLQPTGFGLRLLDASWCRNATAGALSNALANLPQLIYLDLSGTSAAANQSVYISLRLLPGLRVLKLRSLSLSDSALVLIAKAVARRVKSLDVRNNRLTDACLDSLLEECCIAMDSPWENLDHEGVPLSRTLGKAGTDVYHGMSFESWLRRNLSAGFVPKLIFDGAPDSGTSHLYLSGNLFTPSGTASLLSRAQLDVVDLGLSQGPRHAEVNWEPLIKVLTSDSVVGLSALRVDCGCISGPAGQDSDGAASSTAFDPTYLRRLRHLSLINVPIHSQSAKTIDALIKLIRQLSRESYNAKEKVRDNWELPPGTRARDIYALETVILEMQILEPRAAETEDPGVQSFFDASEDDFSFFADDQKDNMARPTDPVDPGVSVAPALTDNIALLAAYRADARQRKQPARPGAFVDGFWDGEIKVVRSMNDRQREMADYLGRPRGYGWG